MFRSALENTNDPSILQNFPNFPLRGKKHCGFSQKKDLKSVFTDFKS
jgi:hypothetical protein